jgi:hypothetical protein
VTILEIREFIPDHSGVLCHGKVTSQLQGAVSFRREGVRTARGRLGCIRMDSSDGVQF